MTVVVDSNILIIYSLFDEQLHAHATSIVATWNQTGVGLAAPLLFRSEITAVLRKIVFQNRITHSQGKTLLSELLSHPIMYYEDNQLLEIAYELAQLYNRPRAYDSQYLALAQRLNCEFWTADERLFNSVKHQFTHIRWLGNWQITL
jgi:predicted nucleic acid-binding protein